MQRSIAFFDFDGTVTFKDSMLALAEYRKGKAGFLLGMAVLSPSLVALKLNLLSAQKAKQLFLKHFFGGMTAADFNGLCRDFSKNILPNLIRKDAWAAIQKHKQQGDEVVIVSASAENWISHWCDDNDIRFIATSLELENDRFTGIIRGLNCNGEEKVSRIKAMFNLADFENIYAYGDSSGDRMMLSLATHPGFRIFNERS